MTHDPLDRRAEELFTAARKESPQEETRAKITLALRTRSEPDNVWQFSLREHRMPVLFGLAAASLGALVALGLPPDKIEISAEPLARRRSPEAPRDVPAETKATSIKKDASPESLTKNQRPGPPKDLERVQDKPAPPTLAQELAGIKSARALLTAGDAASALAELDRFDRGAGFRQLKVEAELLRIEALSQIGRSEEARSLALRFVEKNPNNPLVDRAAKIAKKPVSPETATSVKSESE